MDIALNFEMHSVWNIGMDDSTTIDQGTGGGYIRDKISRKG